MKSKKSSASITLLFGVGILFLWMSMGMAQTAKKAEAHYKYVGVKTCKMCHNNPAKGKQFAIWKSSKHATAYATLATAEAKKLAKAKGITDPQKSPECLKCHVTGYGLPKTDFTPKYNMENGVTCEACHGPGSGYWKYSTMKKIYKGKIKPGTVGLTMPNAKTCETCHNAESPSYKKFVFAKYWAKIAHDIPKKK